VLFPKKFNGKSHIFTPWLTRISLGNYPIRTFLSHAYEDRKIARNLADALNTLSLDVFVAHDDIEIGTEWESALFEEIKKSDLFIVLLSENFRQAKYTDHEVGIAYGLGRIILPLSIDETMTYGFLSKFQAKKIRKTDTKKTFVRRFY